MPWSFRDYKDDRGRNLVAAWFASLPAGARATLNARLQQIRRLQKLEKPYVVFFGGKWNGVCEIRKKADNIQYRLLACRGPGKDEITILLPTFKKKSDVTNDEKDEALRRMRIVQSQVERSCDHKHED
jgi:phage-related protein